MPEEKKSKIQSAKDAVRGVYNAHKDAVNMKNTGKLLGKGAFKALKPFVALYDGAKEGFKSGQ